MTKQPAVIITGLPWIRSGTGKVMQAQVAYFKSMGWAVVFVACPFKRTDAYSRRIWQRFEQEKSDLAADYTAISSFRRRVSRPSIWSRFRGRWRGLNAMHWAMSPSDAASIPSHIIELVKGLDIRLILANHIYTLKVAEKLRAALISSPPVAVVTHDVQSHILKDNTEINPFSGQHDVLEVLLNTEVEALSRAACLVHVSRDDEVFFRDRLPNSVHRLVLPTIGDLAGQGGHDPDGEGADFIFIGARHVANYHAVLWLLEEIWPRLDQRRTIKIVGPVKDMVASRNPSLHDKFAGFFTGSVPDVSRYYSGSRCVLAPMVTGRGVSIKTIEACAYGMPIVGTSFAYRGLPLEAVRAAGLTPLDDPADFAQAAQLALDAPAASREASKRLYRALFSRDAFASSMNHVLDDLGINR